MQRSNPHSTFAVNRVLHLVPDARATHYWDPAATFIRLFEQPLLSGAGDAEGVLLLYGRDASWEDRIPPVPVDRIYAPRDIDRLARQLPRLLER